MPFIKLKYRAFAVITGVLLLSAPAFSQDVKSAEDMKMHRYLYVASPGIRDYTDQSGGHGVLVFDVEDNWKFVKRIPTGSYWGGGTSGKPVNVKGFMASSITNLMYVATIRDLMCFDLKTDTLVWQISHSDEYDRGALSPDGKVIYQAPFYKDFWYVIDAFTGEEITRVNVDQEGMMSHNTIYDHDNKRAYASGTASPWLNVMDAVNRNVIRKVGPFRAAIRPFTINGPGTLAYVNLNGLLGFSIGDITTGEVLHRIEVEGYGTSGTLDRHGCPSHGIAMTADETEVWVVDGYNDYVHVYDNTQMPPVKKTSIKTVDFPGWVTFGMGSKHAYPSSGDIYDVKTKERLGRLVDDEGRDVQGEKMLEVDFIGDEPVRAGQQFGQGQLVDGKIIKFGCMKENDTNFDPDATKDCEECCSGIPTGTKIVQNHPKLIATFEKGIIYLDTEKYKSKETLKMADLSGVSHQLVKLDDNRYRLSEKQKSGVYILSMGEFRKVIFIQ